MRLEAHFFGLGRITCRVEAPQGKKAPNNVAYKNRKNDVVLLAGPDLSPTHAWADGNETAYQESRDVTEERYEPGALKVARLQRLLDLITGDIRTLHLLGFGRLRHKDEDRWSFSLFPDAGDRSGPLACRGGTKFRGFRFSRRHFVFLET